MIYLRITDLLLSPPVTHTSTDWQVATNLSFAPATIVVESIGDKANLTSILFNNPLDPQVKYYARARVLLSTGYTAWSNIDIFTPQDVIAGTSQAALPSIVSIPTFTLTNNGVNVPIFNASIVLDPITTLGGATHESTSYIIEDVNGNVIWFSPYNVDDKLSKVIPPDVLNIDSVYRLRILVHVDSNDSSQLITTTFKTESRTRGLIMTNIANVNPNIPLTVDVTPDQTATGIGAELFAMMNTTLVSVNTYAAVGATGRIINIPAADLKPHIRYILRVTTSDPLIWDQRIFTTTG